MSVHLSFLPPNPYILKVKREFGDVITSLEYKNHFPPPLPIPPNGAASL